MPDETLESLLSEIGLPVKVPAEARALWRWHDGQDIRGSEDRLEGAYFYSIEESRRWYDFGREMQAQLSDTVNVFRDEWLPILDFRQDKILLDCVTGEILLQVAEDPRGIVASQPSLAALLGLWLSAISNGVWLAPEVDAPGQVGAVIGVPGDAVFL